MEKIGGGAESMMPTPVPGQEAPHARDTDYNHGYLWLDTVSDAIRLLLSSQTVTLMNST